MDDIQCQEKIEELRWTLQKAYQIDGDFQSPRVLAISQELDLLINQFLITKKTVHKE